MASVFYSENESNNVEVEIVEEEEHPKEVVEEQLPDEISDEYIGYLSIPKIGLTKGFMDKRSTENDV